MRENIKEALLSMLAN